MAFIAMVIVAIFGLICLGSLFFMILFLILGIVKARKKKKSAKIFFALSTIIFALFLAFLWFLFGPKRAEIVTPDGTVKVSEKIASKLEEYIENEDINRVSKMLEERPELIYYTDINGQGILNMAALTGNVELVECILAHGAMFDDALVFESLKYDYSLEYYFHSIVHTGGDEMTKVRERGVAPMVKCMLENGAAVAFEGKEDIPNALWLALWWIGGDDGVSEDDLEVIQLLVDSGASCTETDSQGDTAMDIFYHVAELCSVESRDPEGYEQLKKILEQAGK